MAKAHSAAAIMSASRATVSPCRKIVATKGSASSPKAALAGTPSSSPARIPQSSVALYSRCRPALCKRERLGSSTVPRATATMPMGSSMSRSA